MLKNVYPALNRPTVREDGDADEDQAARALLNKFLGASLFLTGMESMGMSQQQQRQQQATTTRVQTVQTKSVSVCQDMIH